MSIRKRRYKDAKVATLSLHGRQLFSTRTDWEMQGRLEKKLTFEKEETNKR